jgi:hypothetical protein
MDGDELDCDALKASAEREVWETPFQAMQLATLQALGLSSGKGILFTLSYQATDTDDDEAHESLPKVNFGGFWAKNTTTIKENWTRSRSLSSTAFYNHSIYSSGGQGGSPGRNPLWLKIEEITGTEIKGTFSADLWAGPFHGKDCGRWQLAGDTGGDSGF